LQNGSAVLSVQRGGEVLAEARPAAPGAPCLWLPTGEVAAVGDYIFKGLAGQPHVMAPETFAARYGVRP
jgi:hypothetical protein